MTKHLVILFFVTILQIGCSKYETVNHPEDIVGLRDLNITQHIQSSTGYLLVHFTSYDPNCGYCMGSNEYVNTVAREFKDRMQVARINWEPWTAYDTRSPAVTKAYWIRGLPMLIFYEDGKEVWRGTGHTPANKKKLEQLLTRYIN